MAIKYEQKEKLWSAVAPRVKELIVRDADAAFRSIGAQVEYILNKYYEEELAQGVHHDKRGQREIQD